MNKDHDRLFEDWDNAKYTISKGEPPTEEEKQRAKEILKKVMAEF